MKGDKMGFSQTWHCDSCDFGFLGEGHNSALMSGTTTSVYCEGCETVMDLLTGPYGVETPGAPLVCGFDGTHTVRPWTVEDPCPRCSKGTLKAEPGSGMLTD